MKTDVRNRVSPFAKLSLLALIVSSGALAGAGQRACEDDFLPPQMSSDLYARIGVAPDARGPEVRLAVVAAKGKILGAGHSSEMTELLLGFIHTAEKVLQNPTLRAEYDMTGEIPAAVEPESGLEAGEIDTALQSIAASQTSPDSAPSGDANAFANSPSPESAVEFEAIMKRLSSLSESELTFAKYVELLNQVSRMQRPDADFWTLRFFKQTKDRLFKLSPDIEDVTSLLIRVRDRSERESFMDAFYQVYRQRPATAKTYQRFLQGLRVMQLSSRFRDELTLHSIPDFLATAPLATDINVVGAGLELSESRKKYLGIVLSDARYRNNPAINRLLQ